MKLKKKLILRTIAGDNLLVPIGEAVNVFNGVFTISPSAAVVYQALLDGLDEDEILGRVLKEFEVDEETAKKDIEEFLDQLREFDII